MTRLFYFFALSILLTACGEGDSSKVAAPPHLTLQLNWVPEPEFGGYYAAILAGLFQKEGLTLDVRPGGPGTPALQLVAAGQAEFGITSQDALLIARSRGADLVALFALYQDFPEGIMVHAKRGIRSVDQIFKTGTLAMQAGTPFLAMLQKKYDFRGLKLVPYTNNLAPFLHDPLMAQQCFITAEPEVARRSGIEPQVFGFKEMGYNPYSGVIFTRKDFLTSHPEETRRFLRAVRQGWIQYLSDPGPANQAMQKLNTTMQPETFEQAAQIQKPLILNQLDDPRKIGLMSQSRWQSFAEQLHGLGILPDSRIEGAYAEVAE